MFKLVISDDEGKTTAVPLVREEISIGRKDGNTIRLTERNVSRRHARLQKQNGSYLLHDLGSYNGTLVNGMRLNDSRSLKHGDKILIGDYKLEIVEEVGTEAGPPSNPPPSMPPGSSPSQPGPPPTTGVVLRGEELPAEVRQLRLVFLAPQGCPAPVPLEKLPMILGRSEAVDVALPFSSISREHARLVLEEGAVWVEDLGSANGVSVNGTRTQKQRLNLGDQVTLGVVEFRIARKGESTVLLDSEPTAVLNTVPDKPAAAVTSSAPASEGSPSRGPVIGAAVIAALLLVVAVGFVVTRGSGNTTAPPPPALVASASPNTPPPAEPAANPPAAPPAAPTAAPPEPAPPPPPPEPPPVAAAPPSLPAPPPPPPPAVDPPAPPGETGRGGRSADRGSRGSRDPNDNSSRGANAANTGGTGRTPPPAGAPSPPPAGNPRGAAAASGNTAMQDAMGCFSQAGDQRNTCLVAALRGRASTEREMALLATTYWQMHNVSDATRAMRNYLNRYGEGPSAELFRQRLQNGP